MTAWAALIAWPIISIVFYKTMRLPTALSVTLIGGYLLLPTRTGLDLPLLPALDKSTIPTITALVLTALVLRSGSPTTPLLPGLLPRNPVTLLLMALMVFGSLGTVLTNRDALVFGPTWLPGLSIYDGLSVAQAAIITLIPFLLARKVLATPQAQETLLKVLVIASCAYSLLVLYEVRMSPQLSNMVYGFFPHSFAQHFRSGGWRPVVFLNHGLMLGIFLSAATIAAFGLFKFTRDGTRRSWGLAGIWLFGVLVLSKNLGALLITVTALGILFFLPRRLQVLAIVSIAAMVVVYPVLRSTHVVPLGAVTSLAESIDPARAASFQVRIDNEELLLARAQERPVFGWGGYGRNRIYTEWGSDVSVTDGAWIILLGSGGWVRYIGELGLLSLGAIALWFRRKEEVHPVSLVLGLALAANLVDLIPNSGVSPLTWLMAGALAGRMELQPNEKTRSSADRSPDIETLRGAWGYSRSQADHGTAHQQPKGARSPSEPRRTREFLAGQTVFTRFPVRPRTQR